MNVYSTKQIRNVAMLGHGGAGKTVRDAKDKLDNYINRQAHR